jgi:hypothetical protein
MNTQDIINYIDEVNRQTREYIESTQENSNFAEKLIEELYGN